MANGISLRPVRVEDTDFLFQVYASTRQEEIACFGWDTTQQQAFLRMQFAAQSHYYQAQYPNADFMVILHKGSAIGRMYSYQDKQSIHLIEISLLPEARGQGNGTALLHHLLAQAAETGKSIRLQVERLNRALAWYEALGFRRVDDDGVYIQMEYAAPINFPL